MSDCDIQRELTAEQKGQVYGILSVGCDRETAANFIGCFPADIERAMRLDPAFAKSVRRTEATVELHHMRTVHQAAKDEKNWRTAVWWLERRSPERFGSRGAGTVTARHLKSFLTLLGEGLYSDIEKSEDRERVLARFVQFQKLADDLANDVCGSILDPRGEKSPDEDASAGDEVDSDDFSTDQHD
ncbi:MAG: hypothetical protein IT425_06545 [Pirellulales bacterium]|nr:hypothetical protein [Pirellulales bacterium]